jgi:hypothetical protein
MADDGAEPVWSESGGREDLDAPPILGKLPSRAGGAGSRSQPGSEWTRLQEAAYAAQLAAGLPVSVLATSVLVRRKAPIDLGRCAEYLHAIQRTDWFTAAFAGHAEPVVVVGGPGVTMLTALGG